MSEARARIPFNWPAVFMFVITTVPVLTVFPWYAWKFGFDAFEWKLDGARFQLEVTIPANSTATVYVPASDVAKVTEGGKPVASATGVKFLRMEAGRAVFEVGSGSFTFVAVTAR